MKFSCNECNYEWYATPASVLSHNKCPNFRQHQDYINHNYVDLTGKEYKYLKVIEQVEDYISSTGKRLIQWKCQCKCGNIVFRTTSWLNSNVNQSCGCMRAQAIIDRCTKDLIGQKFGKLLVIKYAGSHKDGAMWECQCDCGNMIITQARYLKRGSIKSCGCLQSYGEETIANFLDENQIAYIRQKTFDGLTGLGNGKLRFDFYIENKNILIEYNGRQHYIPVDFKANNEVVARKNFEKQQLYDDLKRKFAIKNNYKLIEIPYWEDKNIQNILLKEVV